MTAYDLLVLAIAAPGDTHIHPRSRPRPAQEFDRHCVDALRCLFGAEPLFAGLADRRARVRGQRRC